MTHYQETEYGFEYGAAKVSRMTSDKQKGWIILQIETPKSPDIQVYVTKTGKVRIYDSQGEWSSPTKELKK